MLQNWNNIISYIKYELGIPYNLLEITDAQIVDIITEHVLPEFSQHNPAKIWLKIDDGDKLAQPVNFNELSYHLNIPDNIYITSIENCYLNTISPFSGNLNSMAMFVNPIDIVVSNAYATLAASLQPVQSFEYFPPRTICFSLLIGFGVIVEVNTVHQNLETIAPDLYNSVFKKMCLSKIIKYIIKIRSKFTAITTPFGEFNLNISDLQSQVQQLDTDIQAALDSIPPSQLIAWL